MSTDRQVPPAKVASGFFVSFHQKGIIGVNSQRLPEKYLKARYSDAGAEVFF